MNRFFRVLTVLATVLALLWGTGLAAATVDPSSVEAELHPGESIEVEKRVTTPLYPPVVDIFLLEDETGSFVDDIATLQALAPDIWDAIAVAGVDFTMGVGGFRDFAQDGWGLAGDWVYRRTQNLTNTKADFVNGVNALTAVLGAGADGPEAQLEALHYAAVPGHAAIDSNGDGDTTDANDTPMGQQPTWRANAQRVILLATDAECHVTGDPPDPPAGGWPGDAGTTSAAVTGGILNGAGIIVIGLVPDGAGTNTCIDTLAAETGGSVHATTVTGELIKEAILAGLEELTTDVWWETWSDPGINVSLTPDVHYDVAGNTTVVFDETIEVPNDTPPGDYSCTVIFYANKHPKEGEVIGRQTITIKVVPIPVPVDIKPQSCPNPGRVRKKGVVPVAIVGTEGFDVTQVDPATVRLEGVAPLRWALQDVATPFYPFIGKEDCFEDCTTDGPDGYLDLTLKFKAREVIAAVIAAFPELSDRDCLVLTVTGNLVDGRAIAGEDVVVVLKKE